LAFDAEQKVAKGLKQFFRHFEGAHQKEMGKVCPYHKIGKNTPDSAEEF